LAGKDVSTLHQGDDDLHYSDNSHRWIAPSDIEQESWEAELAAHLEEHRANMGSPTAADERGKCRMRRPTAPAPAMPARIIPARRPGAMPARQPTAPAARRTSVPARRPGVAAARR
jgi:hypothetical protein